MSLLWSDNSEYAFPKPQKAEKRVKHSPLNYEKLRACVYENQHGKCADCGKELATLPEMDLHHEKKRKMGSGSRDDRYVTGLCRPCHSKRESQLQWSEK